MCLNPLHIRTRSTELKSGSPLYYDVPCGHCPECQINRYNSYRVRLYYEAISCLDNQGFIFFETLTYDEKHVPHFLDFVPNLELKLALSSCDFTCFSREDWRKYTKNLRNHVSKYNKVTNRQLEIRYFAVSEYGQDVRFTQRPHYHVLLFVSGLPLHDDSFKLVADMSNRAWSRGRTDTYANPDCDYYHWQTHNIIKGQSEYNVRCLTSYLSKYVMKDTDYDAVSSDKLDKLSDGLYATLDDDDAKHSFSVLKRDISPFIRTSINMGMQVLDYLSLDSILESNQITMPDSSKGVFSLNLPLYYRRKLLQETYDNPVTGNKSWRLNTRGLELYSRSLIRQENNLINKYIGFIHSDKSLQDTLSQYDFNMLDLVRYQIYMKNRMLPLASCRYALDIHSAKTRFYQITKKNPLHHSTKNVIVNDLHRPTICVPASEFCSRYACDCSIDESTLQFDSILDILQEYQLLLNQDKNTYLINSHLLTKKFHNHVKQKV